MLWEIFSFNNNDGSLYQKIKQNDDGSPFEMQEDEQALVNAITRLGDVSEGESGNN